VAVVVVLGMSIIMLIVSVVTELVVMAVTTLIISAVTALIVSAVTALVVVVLATIVVASIIAAVSSSIPIVVAMIGHAVTIITSIRSTVMVVEALVTVLVVIVAALGLHGVRGYSKGALQLLALPHGMFGVMVELVLVVHDHVEITFKEGGRSWWICHVSFTRSLARLVSSVVVIFSVEVMHHHVLSVN
jgi:hypothetical protein